MKYVSPSAKLFIIALVLLITTSGLCNSHDEFEKWKQIKDKYIAILNLDFKINDGNIEPIANHDKVLEAMMLESSLNLKIIIDFHEALELSNEIKIPVYNGNEAVFYQELANFIVDGQYYLIYKIAKMVYTSKTTGV